MENWKKIVLRAAGFGAGVAVVGSILLGAFLWWSGRPVKPKPWDKGAITASYEASVASGKDNAVNVMYTLRNNTDEDYKLVDDSMVHFGINTKQFHATDFDSKDFGTVTYPIYIPAKGQVMLFIHLGLRMAEARKPDATDDEGHDYNTRTAQLLEAAAGNISGLVLLDDSTRYEIDMPEGWSERAKEPMRIKAPDTSK